MLSDQKITELNSRALIRGHYKNVASENEGAIISNINIVSCAGPSGNSSCLRDANHWFDKDQGYVWGWKNYPIIIELLQPYEINTVVFRLHDKGDRKLIHDLEVFIICGKNKTKIYESNSASGLIRVSFPDQQVKQIEFFNRGNPPSKDQYLNIVMVQAFYALPTE